MVIHYVLQHKSHESRKNQSNKMKSSLFLYVFTSFLAEKQQFNSLFKLYCCCKTNDLCIVFVFKNKGYKIILQIPIVLSK